MEIVSIIAKTNTRELFDLPISELSFGGNSNIKKGIIPKGGEKGLVDSNIQELENGQVQLTKYTTDKSYIGNPVALLAYDGTGKIVSYPLFSGNKSPQTATQVQEVSFSFKGTPQTISLFSDDGLEDSDIRRFPTGNYSLGGDNPFFKFELYRGSFNIVQLNSSDGFRMNGRLVLAVDMATNKITIGNATYNVVQMHTATLTGGVLNIVKEGNASNSINWTNLAGAVTDYLKPSALGFELKSSLNAFTLSADMLNMTGNSIIATDRTAWMLAGNALSASAKLGSTTNQDWTIVHSNATVATVKAASVDYVVDINTTGNVTLQKGNPRLRLRDTGAGGHTGGFDFHVNGDEFIIDDNTHSRNILRNYLNSSVHTTDFDAEVFGFKNGGTTFAAVNSSGLTLGTISAESTDVDKFLVSNAGLVKFRTGTQLLSDIGGFALPTLTANYVTKSNGTTLANSQIFDNGTNVGIGTASPTGKLHISGGSLASSGVGIMMSSVLTVGRMGTYEAISLGSIHTYFDNQSLELTAGSTNGWVSGVSVTGNNSTLYTGTVRFTTASVERMRITSAGNVGIGTTSPSDLLSLKANSSIGLNASTSTDVSRLNWRYEGITYAWIERVNADGAMAFGVQSSERMRINGSGNVGIGTTSPTEKLHILNTNAFNRFLINNTGDNYNGIRLLRTGGTAAADWQIYNPSTENALRINNGSDIFTINSSGNVGIGTTYPSSKLQIDSTGAVPNASYDTSAVTLNSTTTAAVDIGPSLRFGGQSGNAVATYTFATIQGAKGSATAVDYQGLLKFFTTQTDGGNVERMRIDGLGNVGISNGNPAYKLDVAGTGHFTGAVTFDAVPSSLVDATSSNHLVRYSQWIASASIKYLPTAVKTVALTNITLSGTQTINGVALVATDRVLLIGQTTASQNGIYDVSASGWTRATNSDADSEIRGYIVSVSNGTYAGYKYINTNTSAITVGSTSITYSEFSNTVESDPIFTTWRDTSRTANTFFSAPNGSNGAATFRAIIAADIPTLNQSTTGSAATLTTARSIAASGDATWSVSFNGSADVTAALTLATVATAGTYRSVTINAKGLVTSGTNPTTISGYGITDYDSLWDTRLATKTTSNLTEGSNLYYTNARGIGSVLTGYTSGAGTVAATDTILQAIQKLNGNIGAFSGAYVNLTSNVTGILPIANGGTGSATQNFVDLTTNQTISGIKTFSVDGSFNGITIGRGTGSVSTNTVFSANSGSATMSGERNSYFGSQAGRNTTSGSNNSYFGSSSGYSNTSGYSNVAIGTDALYSVTTGYMNVAIGFEAMHLNSTGFQNIAIGNDALFNNTSGNNNVAFGFESLLQNTTANGNSAFGYRALRNNTTGTNNVGIGLESMMSNTTASNGVALGYRSLFTNTTGARNTAIGHGALENAGTGSNNVGLGYFAGKFIADGSTANSTTNNSVFLGYDARSSADGRTNQIVIGYQAIGNGSNTVSIGNTGITANYFNGSMFYSGTLRPGNITPAAGQFLKANSTSSNIWATIITSDISNLGSYTGFDSRYFTETESNARFQLLDADLTAIAALAGTSGFLKKTAADTWSLDTATYLTTTVAASTYMPLVTGTQAQVLTIDEMGNRNFMNLDHKPLKLNINEIAVGNDFGLLESRSEFTYNRGLLKIANKTDATKYVNFGMISPTGADALVQVVGGGNLNLLATNVYLNSLGGSAIDERALVVDRNGKISAKVISGGGVVTTPTLTQYQIGIGNSANQLDGSPNFVYNNGSLVLTNTASSNTNVIRINGSDGYDKNIFFAEVGLTNNGGFFGYRAGVNGNNDPTMLVMQTVDDDVIMGGISIHRQNGHVYIGANPNSKLHSSTELATNKLFVDGNARIGGSTITLSGTVFKLSLADAISGSSPANGDKYILTFDSSKSAFVLQKMNTYSNGGRTYLIL
jgi:hypothetical protein